MNQYDYNYFQNITRSKIDTHVNKLLEHYRIAFGLYFENDKVIISNDLFLPKIISIEKLIIALEAEKSDIKLNTELTEDERKYSLRLNDKKSKFIKNFSLNTKKITNKDYSEKIGWIILVIFSISEFDVFIHHVLNTPNELPTNTRLVNGFKPNKISSKIIYNRNGS